MQKSLAAKQEMAAKFITQAIGPMRLKDLIRSIRSAKTAADERAVIQKESAQIRTAFKEEQIECLKLVVSPRFAHKRLGYLGVMLLLDENTEVLTLVTNALKNDMNNSNVHIAGLALSTLGNIASAEMARDLSFEVEKLLTSNVTHLRKKAALCALRIMKKVPDMIDTFESRLNTLMAEKHHGVLLTGITLMIEMCLASTDILSRMRTHVPALCRLLKNLVGTGFSPEHDVHGITDPFLQVKILRLLRILGKGSASASEQMNDILTQIATNTESAKNAGNAILYEAVLTIMNIEADHALRVLAINILGRLLANKDNNIRYVALTTLLRTIDVDNASVQRHRTTVLDCLRDPDISIRKRAVDLCFALINENNVRILVRELIIYLESPLAEHSISLAAKLAVLAERFAPNKKWLVNTYCQILTLCESDAFKTKPHYREQSVLSNRNGSSTLNNGAAGSAKAEEIVSGAISLMASTPELHAYGMTHLYWIAKDAKEDVFKLEALLCTFFWTFGESGDALTSHDATLEKGLRPITPSDVIVLIQSLITNPKASTLLIQYGLNALIKASTRFAGEKNRISSAIELFRHHQDMEIQERSLQYMQLLANSSAAKAILEPIPVPDTNRPDADRPRRQLPIEDNEEENVPSVNASSASPEQDVLSMLNNLNMSSGAAAQTKAPRNLLDDVLGHASATTATTMVSPNASKGAAMDLFGQSAPSFAQVQVYQKDGFSIHFRKTNQDPAMTEITAVFENQSSATIPQFSLQVAVPKTMKLNMLSPSSASLPPNKPATQGLQIANPQQDKLPLRLKVSFTSPNGTQINDIVAFDGFP